jgi:rubrerythrin
MAAHSDSRPSIGASRHSAHSTPARASEPGSSTTWNPYLSSPTLESADQGEEEVRQVIMPPASEPRAKSDGKTAASMPSSQTNDMLEKLSTLTDKVKDGVSKEAIVDTVKKFTKQMQQTVAKLGGVSVPDESRTSALPNDDVATGRFSMPARNSLSNSLDGYRPDRDVVAPISVRPNAMELLWVCGDCGQHYPRARECPEQCSECGAPKQHFYAPIED